MARIKPNYFLLEEMNSEGFRYDARIAKLFCAVDTRVPRVSHALPAILHCRFDGH